MRASFLDAAFLDAAERFNGWQSEVDAAMGMGRSWSASPDRPIEMSEGGHSLPIGN